jgi:RNase P subunit RPR2
MAEAEKTFKVLCAACQRPFHVRFPLVRSETAGTGDVVVTCLYCSENVVITISRVYIAEEALVRGLQSRR